MTVEEQQVVHEVLGIAVGIFLGLFFSDNGVVGSRNLEWIQGSLNVLSGLFHQYGLVANVTKSKAMKYHPGTLRSGMSD